MPATLSTDTDSKKSATESAVLVAERLTKRFKGIVAVDDVSLELRKGEILGLLGPNGAGKTTTFQMLLGILTPTSGAVRFLGKDLHTARSEILERVNFSSTYTNLPWNLKVSDTLAFISRMYRMSNRLERVDQIIESFRLKPLLSKSVVSLSAGELTRLNLAKAFINEPEIVLLDEPTASLDPESAHVVREYILKQRADRNISVLFTSHNMAEVETICDRVVFIQRGKIVANDTPRNLARTLDQCYVSLLVEEAYAKSFGAVCDAAELGVVNQDGYSVVTMREDQIAAFISALNSNRIPLHGLTVSRATLEDYFMSQASGQGALYV
jgi:ABC-2 type transport system ATP-binding protein